MLAIAVGSHLFVVIVEVAALLLLVALGAAVNAYYSSRKRPAVAHARADLRPRNPAARATVAAWRRAAWRRANPRAARTFAVLTSPERKRVAAMTI